MKKIVLQFSATAMLACLLFACEKKLTNSETNSLSSSDGVTKDGCKPPPPPPPCPPPPPEDCDKLRTQTPGGWGAPPSGNNPGSYLHRNFESAFGELTVGCFPGNFYVRLTTAQAITNLLPTGGQAQVLTASYVDPPSLKNVLVGHLVALKLSVGFDKFDENFGKSSTLLGDMIIASGPFEGFRVSEFLAVAERVLGGCSTKFTIQQVLQTATAINENFTDGTTNKGFLLCPEKKDDCKRDY